MEPSSITKGVFSFKNFWKNFVFIEYEIYHNRKTTWYYK